MEILPNVFELKNIVEKRAKYQKVMLVYDNNFSNLELSEIYNQIKDICVFNKLNCEQNLTEIYDGYKLIIFCVSANSFLKLNYDFEEFISVFVAADEYVLPFYLDNNCYLSEAERYLIPKQNYADTSALSSIEFNKFYSYISNLLNFQYVLPTSSVLEQVVTQSNVFSAIDSCSLGAQFIDVKIAKQTGVDYSQIILIDFLLVSAFICVFTSVLNNTLELVDTYKVVKDSIDLTDKLYAMQSNNIIIRSIELNSNYLLKAAEKAKKGTLSLLQNVTQEEVEFCMQQLKTYAKDADGLIGYLYLYNIFGY